MREQLSAPGTTTRYYAQIPIFRSFHVCSPPSLQGGFPERGGQARRTARGGQGPAHLSAAHSCGPLSLPPSLGSSALKPVSCSAHLAGAEPQGLALACCSWLACRLYVSAASPTVCASSTSTYRQTHSFGGRQVGPGCRTAIPATWPVPCVNASELC